MLEKLIHSFVTLFVTANPISVVPLFVVATVGLSASERHAVAFRSVVIAGAILVAFALLGNDIIAFFGISIQAFEIGGGLLLFATAFHMVFESEKSPQAMLPGTEDDGSLTQIAVFPLAVPMMAGPGSISAVILLTTHRSSWIDLVGLLGVIVVLMALSYATLMLSHRIDRAMGNIGRIVAGRLLGVILAALAMQFISRGLQTFIAEFTKAAA